MSCTQTNLDVLDTPDLIDASGLGETLPLRNVRLAGPSLMVSDNPETVTRNEEGVLWWQQLPSGAGGGIPDQHTSRLFLWHLNQTAVARNLCVTLENRGQEPLRLLRIRGQVGSVTDFLSHGRCVAAALVAGTLETIQPLETVTQPGAVSLLVRNSWGVNRLVGGQYEITVAEPAPEYVLRVVQCRTESNPRSFNGTGGEPLPANSEHPRGCWSGSEVELEARYEIPAVGSAFDACLRLANKVPGPDSLFLKATCDPQPGATQDQFDNRANFGVVYTAIRLTVDNRSQSDHRLKLLIVPRGGDLAGAVRSTTVLPTVHGFKDLDIIPQKDGQGRPNPHPRCRSAILGTLSAPARQVTEEVITLAVGGAANTPLAIAIRPV